MANKENQDDAVPAHPVSYIVPAAEDEIDLLDLWFSFVKYKKYFFASLVLLIIIGMIGVNKLYQPKYSVTSVIDVGSISTNGEEILDTFYNTLINKIEDEKIPGLLSDKSFAQTGKYVSDTSVSLQKKTSLIQISNKVLREEKDATATFHKRLVDLIMGDLKRSYRLFNKEDHDALLSIQSELNSLESGMYYQQGTDSGKRTGILDESFVKREAEILKQRMLNIENALEVASPEMVLVAKVSLSPVSMARGTIYVLVFVFAVFFSFFVLLIAIFINNIQTRLAKEE